MMMSMTMLLGVILLIGAIVGVVVAARMMRPKAACPFCESANVREIGRNPASTSTYQISTYSPSGDHTVEVMVRSHTDLKFVCEKCGKNFEKTVTETH